jgi:CHRD domain/Secretion system C-terminal sorting domain
LLLSIAMLSAVQSFAGHLTDRIILSARLQGSNEVPSVATSANGVASFMLNATRDTMQVNIAFTGLKATAMHIHEGKVGANGGVFKDLTKNIKGNVARLILTGTDLSPVNMSKFLSGAFYLNVHTAANPSGEIRGQITIEEDKGYFTELKGSNSVPAVVSDATGAGVFSIDKSGQRLQFKVIAMGLSGKITSAHFHIGEAGTVGNGILLDVSSSISGNVVMGTVSLPASFVTEVNKNNIYFNLHTAANPAGEIRGQVTPYNGLQFDALLDNAQLGNPMVSSTGQGVAFFSMNYNMDTLNYQVYTTNLTSDISAAHIHLGEVGVNGGVVFDLGKGDKNVISGQVTGSKLTKTAINQLLRGDFYVNIHTVNNPATGEIRGQIYRLAREGYIMEVAGNQLQPASGSDAMGGGLVTIDRNQSTAHYMIAVDGLSGAVTAAHFHKAIKGENGGVVFPLANATGLYGYWSQSTNPKFTVANSRSFRGDSIYVVFHTAANPNGEVRGQAIRNYKISSTTLTKIIDVVAVKTFKAYPNPVADVLNIEIKVANAMTSKIVVVDMLGRTVLQKEIYLDENQNMVNLDLNDVMPGTYTLTVVSNGKLTATSTFVKI